MKVLVVDDDRAVREALRRTLTLADYEVEVAEDGEKALEQIVQALPDAVVLDVGLPGIDGLEVCRRVRRLGNRVPTLILTARAEVDDRIDGLDVGTDDRGKHGSFPGRMEPVPFGGASGYVQFVSSQGRLFVPGVGAVR